MCKPPTKKIQRGDKLTPALTALNVGESLLVPYRLYSENTLRCRVSNIKLSSGLEFTVNARSNVSASVTRTL